VNIDSPVFGSPIRENKEKNTPSKNSVEGGLGKTNSDPILEACSIMAKRVKEDRIEEIAPESLHDKGFREELKFDLDRILARGLKNNELLAAHLHMLDSKPVKDKNSEEKNNFLPPIAISRQSPERRPEPSQNTGNQDIKRTNALADRIDV